MTGEKQLQMDFQACQQQEKSDGNVYNLQQPNNVFLLMVPPETKLTMHPEMSLCDFDPTEQSNNSSIQSTTSLFSVDSSSSQAFPLYISSSLNTFHLSNAVDKSFLHILVTENTLYPPNNPADALVISDDDICHQSQPATISNPSENILDHQEMVMGYVVPSPETSQSFYDHDLFKYSFEHSEHNQSGFFMFNEGEENADSPTHCTETSFYESLESNLPTETIPLLMPIQEAFPEISFPTNFSTRDENALSVDKFSNPSNLSLKPIEDNVTTIALPQESILLLHEQMRKHVQLLTQMHLITAQQSALASVTEECRSMLKELLPLKQRMEIANLDEALDLVTYWKTAVTKISPETLLKFERTVVTNGEKKTFFKRSCKHPQRYPFNPKMVDLMAQSHVFIYPELLPRLAIFQSEPGPCKMSLHEEQLIAMGMEQFTPFCTEHLNDDTKLPAIENFVNSMISLYMLPNWTPKQIATRIKNKSLKNKKTTNNESNPIKYYRENNVAPPIHHVVQPFDRYTTVRLYDIPRPLLPERWQEEMNLQFTRKSRAANKRALEIFASSPDQLQTSTGFSKKNKVQPMKRRRILGDGIN